MGIMIRRTAADRRQMRRFGALAITLLFAWSFVASPNPATPNAAEEEILEPLSAYHVVADASPLRGLIQHNAYLVAVEPAIARTTSEVSLPSTATSTSWLLDLGTPNGLHGTTTGTKVPTETTATQPGGDRQQSFELQRRNLGDDALASHGAGVVKSQAEQSERPRGYGYAYLSGINLLPAPGSPEAPPGTYDPEADEQKEREPSPSPSASTRPNDPAAFTPNPRGQQAIISIASVSSSAETFREQDTVTSISVAELGGISIGNRTADGRCTNCITINSVRVEARAQSDGTKEGTKSWWRVLLHRACRVAMTNDPATGAAYEGVTCLDPNPDKIIEAASSRDQDAGADALADTNARGIREVRTLDQINTGLSALAGALKPLGVEEIGISIRVGTSEENQALRHDTESLATARGIVIELKTSVAEALAKSVGSNEAIKGLIQSADGGCSAAVDATIGNAPVGAPVPVPRECASAALLSAGEQRSLRLALGHVRASAKASPVAQITDPDDGGDPEPTPGGGIVTPEFPGVALPPLDPDTSGEPPLLAAPPIVVSGGLAAGELGVRLDWSAVGIKPWAPKDLGKGFMIAGLAAAVAALIRRRLRLL